MQEPLLPLTDDELAVVSGSAQGWPEIVEQVRDWITQGHRSPGVNVKV